MADYMITLEREKFEAGLDGKTIKKLISAHESNVVEDVKKCKEYYMGQHAINANSDSSKAQTV